MANPTNRTTFKDYCLRALGSPVINIEVDDVQVDDRVDEALQDYAEAHYDAVETDWVVYKITQADIDNGYITLPDDILVVSNIMPLDSILSSSNMFSYQYQIAMSTLSPWQSFDSVDYFMKVTNYNQITQLTSVAPTIEFTRHSRKLKVFANLERLGVDYPITVEVERIINPNSVSNVWNDKWLKAYATQLIKRQWGTNTKKFEGVQMLGGVTISGQQIFDEANTEIERLKEELETKYSEPVPFFFG